MIMDKKKQQHILKNLDALVKNTNYDVLAVLCISEGIINDKALKIIEADHNKHEELFIKITKRSDKAYDDLLGILKNAQFIEAYGILASVYEKEYDNIMRSLHTTSTARTYILEEFTEELTPLANIQLVDVQKSTEEHTHYLLPTYQMRSTNRGVLFLVNNIEFMEKGTLNPSKTRCGAEYDKNYLISLYREFGFKIFYYENLTLKEFQHYLHIFLHHDVLYETECLIFSILSHGDKNNEIEFSDSKTMDIFSVLFKFNNRNCPALKNKPKIFILPFCRGNSPDLGIDSISIERVQMDNSSNSEYPFCQDMIICYGTVHGFETMRQVQKGSWYVNEFYQVFAKYAHNTDLEKLLFRVHAQVMNLRPDPKDFVNPNIVQTPCVVKWDFNNILYFNPGFIGGERMIDS